MKSAIVTGCTGAVGIALIEELLRENWYVIAVSRRASARMSAIPKHKNIEIVECNLDEMEQLPQIAGRECDVFYHLAWDGTYGEDRMDCIRQNRNVEYTLQAVYAAKKLGCRVFIGAGSQSEFGHVDGVLTPELVCNPDNPYGAAKLSAGHNSRILCKQLGIRHNWCRILSLYGPYDGKYIMVMSIIQSLLKGEKPACTLGEQIWDYIYSKDSARAFRLVAEHGKDGKVYCIGSGKAKKLREYIEVIRDCINPDLAIGFGEREYFPNQVMHLEADISELKQDTGFEIQYSFEDGIKETIEWCKENYLR